MSWDKLKDRFPARDTFPEGFYGCVNAEGEWFDSAWQFDTAVHWCCMNAGYFVMDLVGGDPIEAEALWMRIHGAKKGYSVIHSSLLAKMADAGLIK